MSERRTRATGQRPARAVLGTGVALILAGFLLLAISWWLAGSADPTLRAVGQGMRLPVPYVMLIGFAALVLYLAAKPRPPEEPPQSKIEPTYFGNDSTDFVSRFDRGNDEKDGAPR